MALTDLQKANFRQHTHLASQIIDADTEAPIDPSGGSLEIAHGDGEPSGAPDGIPFYYDDEGEQGYAYVDGVWLPFSSAGGAATIVQRKTFVAGGNGNIVLDSTPTPGNKLIMLFGTAGSADVTATGFTSAQQTQYSSNRRSAVLFRDVLEGDSATRAFTTGAVNSRYLLMEVAGLAPGDATVKQTKSNAVFNNIVGDPMSIPGAGFTAIISAGGTQSASPYLPSPAKLATYGFGPANGGNDPFCNFAAAFHAAAETFTPSFPNDGGFTGDWSMAGGFWPFA